MNRYTTYLASCAILALGATAAHANCDELAALIGEDHAATMSSESSGDMGAGTESGSMDTGGMDSGGEIAKDGSTAPLETDGDTGTTAGTTSGVAGAGTDTSAGDMGSDTGTSGMETGGMDTGEGEVAKDGSTAPLEEDAAVPESDGTAIATSQQSVEAQQHAGSAEATTGGEDITASFDAEALEHAREALASGDDATCQKALDELQG